MKFWDWLKELPVAVAKDQQTIDTEQAHLPEEAPAPTALEQLAIAEEKVRLQLQMDRANIEEGERALQNARDDLNRLHDEAEANATAGAAELQQVMDAVKAAQLENEAAAAAAIQARKEQLAGKLAQLAAEYQAACIIAECDCTADVDKIADKVDADRDEMLTKVLAASRVFEDAERTAVGW
jgi:hypothetical protein